MNIMNVTSRITHISVAFTCALTCLGLWALLDMLAQGYSESSMYLPRFTGLILGLRMWLLWLPVPVVAYAAFSFLRRKQFDQSGIAFLSLTMSSMCLLFFTVLSAVAIPFVMYLSQN